MVILLIKMDVQNNVKFRKISIVIVKYMKSQYVNIQGILKWIIITLLKIRLITYLLFK